MVPGAPVPKVQALREPTPKGRVVSGVKMLLGTLFVLGSILYANVAFFDVPDSQPRSVDGGAVTAPRERCPEDAVRLLPHPNAAQTSCQTVDDLPTGQVRAAAEGMTAHCPAGTAVVEVNSATEVVGWCASTGGKR